jgi:hypothetical protein
MSKAIAEHELSSLGLKRVANVTQYGAAINCFTLAAGLILSGGHDLNTQLFLLDGDRYTTQEDQLFRTEKVLTGTEEHAKQRRQSCIDGIKKLCATPGVSLAPEPQLHRMIRDLPLQEDNAVNEIITLAQDIQAVDDTHSFVVRIIQTLNVDRAVGMANIVRVAAYSPAWGPYVEELRIWLTERRSAFVETPQAVAPGA